jgi:hypothetical protein
MCYKNVVVLIHTIVEILSISFGELSCGSWYEVCVVAVLMIY